MDQRSKWIIFAMVIAGVVGVGCILLALLAGALSWRVTGSSEFPMRGDRVSVSFPGRESLLAALAIAAGFLLLLRR